MTVASELVDTFRSYDIDTIFGIPGKQTLPLNQAVEARPDIRFVMARNETAVSHQAWGYAESSGSMAATLVVPGPGDLHAANGLKNARNDNTPLLHVAVETEPELRGGDAIHETPPDTYDNVVEENVTVTSPESTIAEVERAIQIARQPPKGPVRVGIPKNFLQMETTAAAYDGVATTRNEPPAAEIDRAARKLAHAERPVIIAGGGVRSANAETALRSLAERLESPVVTTYKGKGTFPEDHDLSAGVVWSGLSPELRALVEESDLALAVGTDFDAVWTGAWSLDVPQDLVHVTMESSDVGTGYEPTVGIVADAKSTLEAIENALNDASAASDGGARVATVRSARDERLAALRADDEPPLTTVSALAALREVVPRDTIVTADAGGSRLWTLVAFPTYGPREYVNVGSWATMATSLPAAIGAQVANPGRSVVALAGEGGLMMSVHELQTLAAESLDVTVVVFNNNDYAVISEEAERSYGVERDAFRLNDEAPDFVAIAEGMGVPAERATTVDDIRAAMADSLESDGPGLVEIPTDPSEPQASEWMTR